MVDERITIDAAGRHAAGTAQQRLAAEYAGFAARLGDQWGDASPLPFVAFSVPYLALRKRLLEHCADLSGQLKDLGDGQVSMAGRNADAERSSTPGDVTT
jgi:hypothetical protein